MRCFIVLLTFATMSAWAQPRFASVQLRPVSQLPDEVLKTSRTARAMRLAAATNSVTLPYERVWDLVTRAFSVSWAQIQWGDSRAWRDDEMHYEVAATLPAGASVMDVPAMTETLLKDKFGLVYHRENRMTQIYSMIVDPEKNPKLKVALRKATAKKPLVVTRNQGWSSPTWDLDMTDTSAAFAAALSERFHIQVRDDTKLSGNYIWHCTLKTNGLSDGQAHIVDQSGAFWQAQNPRPLLGLKEAGVQLRLVQTMLPNIVIDKLQLQPLN